MTKEQEDAIVSAYMGICVLSTMCDKAGLHLGRARSNELLKELSEAFPDAYYRALLSFLRYSEPDATPAGAVVAETSGATDGETATSPAHISHVRQGEG